MRKLFTSIALLLLTGSAVHAADPISPRLDSLRARTFEQLNIPPSGTYKVTTAIANAKINIAQMAVAQDYPAILKLDTLVGSVTSEGIALPSDFLRVAAVQKVKGDSLRLPVKPLDKLSNPWKELTALSQYIAKSNDLEYPKFYYVWGQRLMFLPKYSQPTVIGVDSFLVLYEALPQKMVADSDTTLIPVEYRDLIIDYACAELSALRENWGDYKEYMAKYARRKVAEEVE